MIDRTLDSAHPIASALALAGERIVAVEDDFLRAVAGVDVNYRRRPAGRNFEHLISNC